MGKRADVDPKQDRSRPGAASARGGGGPYRTANGVSEPTLYRWRDEFLDGGQQALAGNKGGPSTERQRIEKLERELGHSVDLGLRLGNYGAARTGLAWARGSSHPTFSVSR